MNCNDCSEPIERCRCNLAGGKFPAPSSNTMSNDEPNLIEQVMKLNVCRVKDLCSENPAQEWGLGEKEANEIISLVKAQLHKEFTDFVMKMETCDTSPEHDEGFSECQQGILNHLEEWPSNKVMS